MKQFTLVRGKHYLINTSSMEQQLRNMASSKKYRLAISLHTDHDAGIIKVRIVGKLDDIPKKGRRTTPSYITTFGRAKVGTQFRFVLSSGKVDYVNPVYTKMPLTGIQGKPYNASYTYQARSKWRTRYVMVQNNQRVGVIEEET